MDQHVKKTVLQAIGVHSVLNDVVVAMMKKEIFEHVIQQMVYVHVKRVIVEKNVMNPVKLVHTVQTVDLNVNVE